MITSHTMNSLAPSRHEPDGVCAVALVNMPFAAANRPSIALTQLRSALRAQLGERVRADIFYFNHDLAEHFGVAMYTRIADSVSAMMAGLGDWLFRRVAFPDRPDNRDEYFQRHARQLGLSTGDVEALLDKREQLEQVLNGLIDAHALDRYDVVGFTSVFAQNVATFALARLLKRRNPDLVVIAGGANCEATMGQVIARNVDAIDHVFSGPSLRTFPLFVERLLAGQRDECHRITGVYSRRRLALQVDGNSGEIGDELDIDADLPLDYDDFMASVGRFNHGQRIAPKLLFETSRGCWWGERSHCTFCGLNGTTMNYRAMQPGKAIGLINRLFGYAPAVTEFESVDNIMPMEYLSEVFPHITPPEGACLFYETKANLKDKDLKVLAAAGVREIQPGIESLATSSLKLMKKGITSFQNVQLLQRCLRHGVKPGWNLLIGFPGEEEAVYRKYVDDIPKLLHLPPPTGVYPIRFDRFSPYFVLAEEHNLKLQPYDFYAMVYPFSDADLERMAYFFTDANVKASHVELVAKWIDRIQREINRWRDRWLTGAGDRPELVMTRRGSGGAVYDSRSDVAIEHEVDELGCELLEAINKPTKRTQLKGRFDGVTETDVNAALDRMHASNLLFCEGETCMSLVMSTDRERGSL